LAALGFEVRASHLLGTLLLETLCQPSFYLFFLKGVNAAEDAAQVGDHLLPICKVLALIPAPSKKKKR
jgi:hypothetical protein